MRRTNCGVGEAAAQLHSGTADHIAVERVLLETSQPEAAATGAAVDAAPRELPAGRLEGEGDPPAARAVGEGQAGGGKQKVETNEKTQVQDKAT